MTRLLRPLVTALIALALSATATLAWQAPVLTAECASLDYLYDWTITLSEEDDQLIELSFDNFETVEVTADFETAGEHQFSTERLGDTLYVRYASDYEAAASAVANSELCEQPEPTPTPKPTPVPLPSPLPSPLAPPPSLPDTSLAMDAEQPETFTPNWPAGIAAFVLVLVIGLPVAWKLTDER